MSTKRCSYKGCRSIQTPEISSSETFFQFPKDETRYELWMTLSRCEDKNTKGTKYLCSKHFDSRKYMSSNPRRKLLLTTAIPYAYQSDNEDNEDEEEERLQDVVSTQFGDGDYFTIREELDEDPTEQVVEEERDIELQYVESSDSAQVEIVDQSDYKSYQQQTESRKKLKLDNGTYCRKEKAQRNDSTGDMKIVQVCTATRKISPSHEASGSKTTNDVSEFNREEINEDDLIIDPVVTTFIFKNEEYVQMPKKFYMKEKLELLKEVQYYKEIITSFKGLLDNVKL